MQPTIINTKVKPDTKKGFVSLGHHTIGIQNTGNLPMTYQFIDKDGNKSLEDVIEAGEPVNFPMVLNREYDKLEYNAENTECRIIAIG